VIAVTAAAPPLCFSVKSVYLRVKRVNFRAREDYVMRQIVHIVGLALFCAIAISNAGTASETGGGRYLADVKTGKLILESGRSSPSGETSYRPELWSVVAQQVVKPAEESTTKIEVAEDQPTAEQQSELNSFIQEHFHLNAEATQASSCGGTGQIAACSGACSAACIFKCFPPNTPWDDACKTCVNTCMDKCTGCGSGSGAIQ
jgi:hypothetical protein